MTLSSETLAAYVDGELEGEALRRAEAVVAADPQLQAQVRRHRALKAKLNGHFAAIVAMPVPDRLVQAIRGGGAHGDNVVDFASAAARRVRPAPPRFAWFGPALAASLVAVVIG